MFTQNKKQNQGQGDVPDFFTPIAEIFHGFVMLIGELLVEAIKFSYAYFQSSRALVRTIEQKELRVTNVARSVKELGY